jgi:hypothetical protein
VAEAAARSRPHSAGELEPRPVLSTRLIAGAEPASSTGTSRGASTGSGPATGGHIRSCVDARVCDTEACGIDACGIRDRAVGDGADRLECPQVSRLELGPGTANGRAGPCLPASVSSRAGTNWATITTLLNGGFHFMSNPCLSARCVREDRSGRAARGRRRR